MENSQKWKPCPFCGSRRINSISPLKKSTPLGPPAQCIQNMGFWSVSVARCESCNTIFAFPWKKSETIYDLGARWNERSYH